MARTARRQKITVSVGDIQNVAADYAQNRTLRARAAKREEETKKTLMGFLETAGEEVEGGHRLMALPEPLPLEGKVWVGMKRQRSESNTLNPERTEAWLRAKGLWDACTTTVTLINEDAILALNFSEKISDKDMKSFYDQTERFSFIPVYGSAEDLG